MVRGSPVMDEILSPVVQPDVEEAAADKKGSAMYSGSLINARSAMIQWRMYPEGMGHCVR